MPYDRTRHQELLAKLDAGLAKVSGPQFVDNYTDSSDGAFTSMLGDVLTIIHDRLTNGRNSAVIDLLLTPANILMAGRLVDALEERGFYCSEMRRKSEASHGDYLTFEAVLLPLKEEEVAAVTVADKADVAGKEPLAVPRRTKSPVSEHTVTEVPIISNSITPGTVVYVSALENSTNAALACSELRRAGYAVRATTRTGEAGAHRLQLLTHVGAPENERLQRILAKHLGLVQINYAPMASSLYPNEYNVFICD